MSGGSRLIAAASANQAKTVVAPVSVRSVSTSVASSGDDAGAKVGVWFSGNFGLAKQSKYNDDDGFRSTSYSGVAGADTMLSDNLTAGFALMAAHSKLQFRDDKQGDETTTKSYGMTLYGSYDFNNGFMTYGNMGQIGRAHAELQSQ